MKKFQIRETDKDLIKSFVVKHHYSSVFPRITKHYLGVYEDSKSKLVGAITLGLGTKPKHTINKILPKKVIGEYTTDDYYEIGKLCIHPSMPKNTGSQIIRDLIVWLKELNKSRTIPISYLYTMADGIVGKSGYLYQASNFYYQEQFWTSAYVNETGGKFHRRSLRGLLDDNNDWCKENIPNWNKEKLFDMTPDYMKLKGMEKIYGLMFRYIYPLNKEAKNVLDGSGTWQRGNYPKVDDLKWKKLTSNGVIKLNGLKESYMSDREIVSPEDLNKQEKKVFDDCKKQLNTIWDKNIEGVFKTGEELSKCKKKIKKLKYSKTSTWKYFVDKYFPISLATADKLIAVSESERLERYKKKNILPFSYSVLYEIHTLESKVFKWAVNKNLIHRGSTRNDVASFPFQYENDKNPTPQPTPSQTSQVDSWKIATNLQFKEEPSKMDVDELEKVYQHLEDFIYGLSGVVDFSFDLTKLKTLIVEKKNNNIKSSQKRFEIELEKLWNGRAKYMDEKKVKKIKNVSTANDICKVLRTECNPPKDWRNCLEEDIRTGEIFTHGLNIPSKLLKRNNKGQFSKVIPDLPEDWKKELVEVDDD
ncbi:hypothetical protein HOK09_04970 [Candidatus Woesearchaeota archaeon]|nr:hypothetical protein [Candidatus Woesearchaeota archaeon]